MSEPSSEQTEQHSEKTSAHLYQNQMIGGALGLLLMLTIVIFGSISLSNQSKLSKKADEVQAKQDKLLHELEANATQLGQTSAELKEFKTATAGTFQTVISTLQLEAQRDEMAVKKENYIEARKFLIEESDGYLGTDPSAVYSSNHDYATFPARFLADLAWLKSISPASATDHDLVKQLVADPVFAPIMQAEQSFLVFYTTRSQQSSPAFNAWDTFANYFKINVRFDRNKRGWEFGSYLFA